MKKDKMANNSQQNNTQTTNLATRTPLKTGSELIKISYIKHEATIHIGIKTENHLKRKS